MSVAEARVEYRTFTEDPTNKVLDGLCVKSLLEMPREDFVDQIVAVYIADNPSEKRRRKKIQGLLEASPDYAWAIREILEGPKWDSAQDLMQAYAELWPLCCRDARSYLNTGLGYALENFTRPTEDAALNFIRENIVNGTLQAHQAMRDSFKVDLPEIPFEKLAAHLSFGKSLRVTPGGNMLILTEKVGGQVRDVNMAELERWKHRTDVANTLSTFDRLQEIFAQEVKAGDKRAASVQIVDGAGEKHQFVVLCTQEEHFAGKHLEKAASAARYAGLEPKAKVELPVGVPEIEAVLEDDYGKPALRKTFHPDHSCFDGYLEWELDGETILVKETSEFVCYAVPSLDFKEGLVEDDLSSPGPR